MSMLNQFARLRLTNQFLRQQVGRQLFSSSSNQRSGDGKNYDRNASDSSRTGSGSSKKYLNRKESLNHQSGSLRSNNPSQIHGLGSTNNSNLAGASHSTSNHSGRSTGSAGEIKQTGHPSSANSIMGEHQKLNKKDSDQSISRGSYNHDTVSDQKRSGQSHSYNLRSSGQAGDRNPDQNATMTSSEGGRNHRKEDRKDNKRDDRSTQVQKAGRVLGTTGSVMNAVKQTGHKIMEKMSKASEATKAAGHTITSQAKSAINEMGHDAKEAGETKLNSADTSTMKANHEPELNRFSIVLGDDEIAVLQYKLKGDDVIEYYHTEVPINYRGRGVATVLARAAFDHASDSHLKMKLSCSYLIDYLNKNPTEKYNRIVIEV